jgi:hypothetical protein
MLARQAMEGQRFFDVLLDPVDQPGIRHLPLADPGGERGARLRQSRRRSLRRTAHR